MKYVMQKQIKMSVKEKEREEEVLNSKKIRRKMILLKDKVPYNKVNLHNRVKGT